jgi:hypothetical protein
MTHLFSKQLRFIAGAALAGLLASGCDSGGASGGAGVPQLPELPGPDDPDPGPDPGPKPEPQTACNTAPACNDQIEVDPNGPALLVTDPEILAEFPLEKVIKQILDFQGIEWAPEEMMQRFFDTMNTEQDGKFADVVHCNSDFNPATQFKNGDSFICPRAEGILASSKGFFKDGDPDSFFPVAVVNRFDLTPINGAKCGQYRIVYAKRSGLTDPDNRVFLIFEAALANPAPGCLESCRPVAQFWQSLEGKTKSEIATHLRTFFFAGIPGFKPAVHPVHYGLGGSDQGYGGTEGGQIRVSMHMGADSEWNLREMRMDANPQTGLPTFLPATVKNNPPAFYFDPQASDFTGMGQVYRQNFIWNDLQTLSGKELKNVQMFTQPETNGAESLISGEKKNDYFASAVSSGDMSFLDLIQQQIDQAGLDKDCPANDLFDAEAAIQRATVLSCAGCHAPKAFLGEDRSIGCGLTWPDTLGQSHISEKGEISPALKDVFLPHRADVMKIFLQACDLEALNGSLQQPQNSGGGGPEKNMAAARTIGGSQSH